MRKFFLLSMMFLLTMSLISYEYDYTSEDIRNIDSINDTRISFLAGEDTVWFDFGIRSPVDTYNPAIQFQTRFILNDRFRLGLVGSFFNEAKFEDHFDEVVEENYTNQEWDAIKNFMEVYLGFRLNTNIHLGFMLGGGVNMDQYYKKEDLEVKTNCKEEIIGYAFVRAGFGIKLSPELFYDNLSYFFVDQFLECQLNGNGSMGIENFSFNTPLERWKTIYDMHTPLQVLESMFYNESIEPTVKYKENSAEDDYFMYTGIRSWGKIGFSIPFHMIVYELSRYNKFELKIEIDHKFNYKVYSYYENYVSYLQTYTIKNHFDPSGIAILAGILFRPVKSIEICTTYKPNFIVAGTSWAFDGVDYRDYLFIVVHEIEAAGVFTFPKVVALKMGARYYITQRIEYQYENDGKSLKESWGGGSLGHTVKQTIRPELSLIFTLIEKRGAKANLGVIWSPKVILYEWGRYKLATDEQQLDANILNLANWEFSLEIEFDPKKL
ncbi:MAG: hypothetical protein KAT05_12190 [Spirochaetes bacterium]|nr:hypothetical protein [Spirochaetota bacterium]